MIIRHMMNTPIVMPTIKPNVNCSMPTILLYVPHRPEVK